MPKLSLNFNREDEGLENLRGTVSFPSDFPLKGLEMLSIGGLGEWRNVNSDTIHLNEHIINTLLNPIRKAKLAKSKVRWAGLKAKTDMLLSYSVRKAGTKAIIAQLTTFFKTLSTKAKVEIILDNSKEI